jgi:demethylmenaquinone methyltransferase/2-methoxy-6-polyprenyl-1,4-benzoquinol methylase
VVLANRHPHPFPAYGGISGSEEIHMPLPAVDRNRFAQYLFTPLPSRYDRLAEVLSMGQNGRWRKAMVDHIVPAHTGRGDAAADGGAADGDAASGEDPEFRTAPADPDFMTDRSVSLSGAPPSFPGPQRRLVLDVASGTAGVALQIASRTGASVVGVDLTEEMLRQGQRNVAAARRATARGTARPDAAAREAAGPGARVCLVAGRAEELPFPDASFDALTFTYLLRYVDDPQATLAELARVIKPGGLAASLEFSVPPNPAWRSAWWLYTRLVLPAGGLITGGPEWLRVGRFLGPNISGHYRNYPISWTVDAWRKAGFDDVGFRLMSLGGGLIMWGTRNSD